MTLLRFALALSCLVPLVAGPAAAQVAGTPEVIGTIAGPGSTPVNSNIGFFGTDLGWTVEHKGELRILFGDTDDAFDSKCFPMLFNDDSQGRIPLVRPEGVPPLTMDSKPGEPDVLQRIIVTRKGESLQMGYGQVPTSAYSDGKHLVGIVGRGGTIHCKPDAPNPIAACRPPLSDYPALLNWWSAGGLRCSQTVGECVPALWNIPTPCELATGGGCNALLGETCQPTPHGICVDPTSSQNNATPYSERFTAAWEVEFAVEDPNRPGHYDSLATMRTNKFINPAARTIKRFTFLPFANDYRPGSGALLVWGRPLWDGELGRQSQLYLMVHKLPIPKDAQGRWVFQPWFYGGVGKHGFPRWSQQQEKAAPLALDGVVGGSPFEEQPLVNQQSISWVGGSIRKWVMLYAGNIGDFYLEDPANARPGEGPGSIRIRFADHPWGPWSPAKPHLLEGSPFEANTLLGPGGYMFHPLCVDQPGLPCAPSDEVRGIDFFFGCAPIGKTFDYGFLYGPNIIDNYTESDGAGGMNIYWVVSTWNPYAVLYVKTNLKPH